MQNKALESQQQPPKGTSALLGMLGTEQTQQGVEPHSGRWEGLSQEKEVRHSSDPVDRAFIRARTLEEPWNKRNVGSLIPTGRAWGT